MSGTTSPSSIHTQVRRIALAKPAGEPFCFAELIQALPRTLRKHRAAVQKAVSRLVQSGTLSRVMRGIYMIPKQTLFGAVPPQVHRVMEAYAQQHHMAIGVHGAVVVNELGLSTQVPAKFLYNAPIHGRRALRLPTGEAILTHAPKYVLQAVGTIAEGLVAGLAYLGAQQRTLCGQLLDRCGAAAREQARKLSALPHWMQQVLSDTTITA